MTRKSWQLHRRTFLAGTGVALSLPLLECMADDPSVKNDLVRRCCFIYSANGVSLPPAGNRAHKDWNWFPEGIGQETRFTKTLRDFETLRENVTVISGVDNPTNGPAHICSDIWLTHGDLSKNKYQNSISVDQLAALKFRDKTRQPFLAFSCDGGVGFKSRIGTISFDGRGNPVPTENKPRSIFERLFSSEHGSKEQRRRELTAQAKMIDRVLENAKSLDRRLGRNDRRKLDEYMTAVSEIEERVDRYDRWLDSPLKIDVDPEQMNLDVDMTEAPGEYYRVMFDLIALAFRADVTRVATFMMSREDGMGTADSFPTILNGSMAHHALSHGTSNIKDGGGYVRWAKYDRFLASRVAGFVTSLSEMNDAGRRVLDDTLVMYGSGCSTTHNTNNLPLILAGGRNMGLKHHAHVQAKKGTMLNSVHLSMIRAMGIPCESFGQTSAGLPTVFR